MSKKIKITVIISICWVLFMFSYSIPEYGATSWPTVIRRFFLIGLLPPVFVWGMVWIFRSEGKQDIKSK